LLPPAPRRPAFSPQSAALYAACWLPLVVAYIGVLTTMTGGQLSVLAVTVAALLNTLGPALLGIVVWWLTGRFPVPRRMSTRFAAAHLAFGTAYVASWMVWELIILGPLGPARPPDPELWIYVLPWQGIIGYMMYAVVAGISYAVRGAFMVNDLAVTAATAERLRAEAELAVLRAHLDPHFLFNTLHGVMQLLRDDAENAERALERLADLLRYVLRLDRSRVRSVTLDAEWRFVQSYLWLEQLRLGDRLKVVSALDDDALACVVPPFCLQPLVENAVRHGLAPKPGGGTLRVTARMIDDQIEIMVADDGLGAAEPPDESSPGLGIPAVLRRVRGYFGADRVTADITTSTGSGFVVRMTMPAHPTDDGENLR
jgi:hypothetical protein